jgi:hypothetical protein
MHPHRRSNRGALIAAVCIGSLVVGLTAWATLSGGLRGPSDTPPVSTPRDLRSQDLPSVELETASPSDRPLRTTAVVRAVTHGIAVTCDDASLLGAIAPGSTFDRTCTATSVGSFEGTATFACASTSWLTCDVYPARDHVSPDEAVPFGVSVKLGPLAPAGAHGLRVEARSGSQTYDTQLPFLVKATGVIGALPTFVCDAWSALVHPGGVVRTACELLPRAYTGAVDITCTDAARCHAEPHHFVTTGRTTAIPFELVVSTPYDAPPFDVTQTVGMTGGSGQLHAFAIEVPAVVGKVDVDCPLTLSIPTSGTTPLHCTLASTDGFDGYVRVSADALLPIGSVGVEATDVRVPLGETVDVTVPVVSSGLPLAPIALTVDLTPVAWSDGPVSVALNVVL